MRRFTLCIVVGVLGLLGGIGCASGSAERWADEVEPLDTEAVDADDVVRGKAKPAPALRKPATKPVARAKWKPKVVAQVTKPAAPEPAPQPKPEFWDGKGTCDGIASFYAGKFIGRKTANGERYTGRKLTAAHRVLPFGTHVKVTNLKNGLDVIVRINDRGPFVDGRVIDLSPKAASRLHMTRDGVVPVRLDVVAAWMAEE
jgi:rare lipoprotein A